MDLCAGVRAKIARAWTLLLELDDVVGRYLESDPVRLQRQVQPDGQTSVFALQIEKAPPLELSVRAGEVVHQLRSAVDHLAHGLVLASGNTPTRRTVFPVLSTRPSALHVDGGVSAAALAAIDAVQPYQRRDADRHPLHVLHRLWNIDKHRSLHVTVAQVTGTQIFLGTADGSALFGGQFRTDPLGHDDIIGAFELANGAEAANLLVEASGSLYVALGDSGPWPTDRPMTLVLEDLHRYVTQTLLPQFEPLLGGTAR